MSSEDMTSFLGETKENTEIIDADENLFTPQMNRIDPFAEAELSRQNEVLKSAYKELSEKFQQSLDQNDLEIIQLQTQFQEETNELKHQLSREKMLSDIFLILEVELIMMQHLRLKQMLQSIRIL